MQLISILNVRVYLKGTSEPNHVQVKHIISIKNANILSELTFVRVSPKFIGQVLNLETSSTHKMWTPNVDVKEENLNTLQPKQIRMLSSWQARTHQAGSCKNREFCQQQLTTLPTLTTKTECS